MQDMFNYIITSFIAGWAGWCLRGIKRDTRIEALDERVDDLIKQWSGVSLGNSIIAEATAKVNNLVELYSNPDILRAAAERAEKAAAERAEKNRLSS
jgi:hypothetical protein